MLTIYNEQHTLHQGRMEMFRGQLVPSFEVPARVDHVLKELNARSLGPVSGPDGSLDDALLRAIHSFQAPARKSR